MSDNIKLVIEIPKGALKVLNETGVDWLGAEHILSAVADGKPLSDVLNEIKAEIESGGFTDLEGDAYIYVPYAFAILDNIGKTESEDK